MKIGKKLYVADRKAWRTWLKKHHKTATEIWLIYYKKGASKPRIPYNDAVEEALCFGWIDSLLKPIDHEKYAQRFSPRKKNSQLSPMNKERVRRLIRSKRMTRAGLEAIQHRFDHSEHRRSPHIPPDIQKALQQDKVTWRNFSRFPDSYKRIRIGWIHASRRRPDVFRQRLNYFLKMTKQNKKFGMVQ